MRSVISSESACPPMMTRAIEPREPEPGPRPSAIGTMPNTSMTVVIRIGRRRTRFASRMAASRGRPRPRSVLPHRACPVEDAAALDELLAGARVVLNAAGPFAATAAPLVDACLRARAHYL